MKIQYTYIVIEIEIYSHRESFINSILKTIFISQGTYNY